LWLGLVPTGVLASPPDGTSAMATGVPGLARETIPSTVRSYSGPTDVLEEPLTLPEGRRPMVLDLSEPAGMALLDEDAGSSSGWKKWAPVGLSLLVPGAGEIYMGYYWRGAALVAMEVTAWTGYAINRDKGNQKEFDYRRFADAHWSEAKWIEDHNALYNYPGEKTYEVLDSIGSDPNYDGWPGYHPYVFPEENAINYYENIGKYDWFISGWEDWDPLENAKETDLRTRYKAMRKESDDYLDRAQRFIYISIAARALSLIETTILVQKKSGRLGGGAAPPQKELRIDTRARGWMGGEVALEYRF